MGFSKDEFIKGGLLLSCTVSCLTLSGRKRLRHGAVVDLA